MISWMMVPIITGIVSFALALLTNLAADILPKSCRRNKRWIYGALLSFFLLSIFLSVYLNGPQVTIRVTKNTLAPEEKTTLTAIINRRGSYWLAWTITGGQIEPEGRTTDIQATYIAPPNPGRYKVTVTVFGGETPSIEASSEINVTNQAVISIPSPARPTDSSEVLLDRISTLMDFSAPASKPAKVIVTGIDTYVLDPGADRLYKYLLSPNGEALQPLAVDPIMLRKGDVIGNVVVGELVDMTWMEASGERRASSLLILDEQKRVFEYDPIAGLRHIAVPYNSAWKQPKAMAGYFGILYLLDTIDNQVLRYLPSSSGYVSPPFDYIVDSVEIGGALDMAVNGSVYILLADGTIMKFIDGRKVPFPMISLDKPLRFPTSIFVDSNDPGAFVYATDFGNRRVVQFDQNGAFIRQFKSSNPSALSQLMDIFVDERAGRFYILDGNRLLLAKFNCKN